MITITYTVWCDGVDTDGCNRWEYADVATRTRIEARKWVNKTYGWATERDSEKRLVDRCPDHKRRP